MKFIQILINKNIVRGINICVHTSGKRLVLKEGTKKEGLAISVKISYAMMQLVNQCAISLSYLIAKGGITSSNVEDELTLKKVVQKLES